MQSASTTHRNIKAISELEKETLAGRSFSARIGDAIATQAGKMWFIAFHAVWFGAWVLLNRKSGFSFDPYPFQLLNLIVSLEAIFLSLFILMSENRSGLQADQRSHLDLQINLLTEDENTKMIQMLQALCEKQNLSIARDPEILAMAKRTDVTEVLSALTEQLPATE
jgi:uncharacterized membrane protein